MNVIDVQRHSYDYEFHGQTRFEKFNENNKGTGSKKYSMTSSLNEYPSSGSNEKEIEFSNGEK